MILRGLEEKSSCYFCSGLIKITYFNHLSIILSHQNN